MFAQLFTNIAAASLITLAAIPSNTPIEIASHSINLAERTPGGGQMSDVMADNILLNLAYLNDEVNDAKNINWDEIRKSRTLEFRLKPGEAFAYHEDFLPDYEGKIVLTTKSKFNSEQGFKHDGYLMGDGVCHLASFMNWVAKDSGLKTEVPTNHDFMPIPGVAREQGVAIYFMPGSKEANARQNLYITNTKDKDVIFRFIIDNKNLELKVLEEV